MFCEKCGAQNPDGAKFCAGCGSPLSVTPVQQPEQPVYRQPEQPVYQQPEQPVYRQPEQPVYPQQPVYQQPYQYQQPAPAPAPKPQRSVGAIILYMISGGIAVLTLLMAVLPHMTVNGQNLNPFQFSRVLVLLSRNQTESEVFSFFVIFGFAIPMILQLVWAILSFVRLRGAGIVGLIGSIIGFVSSLVWMFILLAIQDSASARVFVPTAVPAFLIMLTIAGIVLSIIQITKRNRVR